MSANNDESVALGNAALELRFVTREQLQHCLGLRRELAAKGIRISLREILVKNGFLTPHRLKVIQEVFERDRAARARPSSSSTATPPAQLAGYRILAVLGKGSMGTVYRAHQRSVDRIVALKVPRADRVRDRNFVKRFLREARSAAKLSHPNIATVYDAGKHGDTYYIAMEYVDGPSLFRLIDASGGKLPEIQAVGIAFSLAQALHYIQQHGLVHRDIKPQNILMTRRGIPKLVDLGLAMPTTDDGASLSMAGMVIGTPNYMSPEQVHGRRDLDIRSDIYSLGATLFKAVTGRPPFAGPTAAVVFAKHLRDPMPDPRKLNPGLSEKLVRIIAKCMAKDRNARYASPRELGNDLKALYRLLSRPTRKKQAVPAAAPPSAPPPRAARPAPRPKRRRHR